MRSSSIGVVVAVLIHASLAAAQPGVAPSAAPPRAPPAADAGEPPLEAGIRDDAASGRTWLSPTALTPPAGTFGVQSIQILIAGASYSPTDRLAISANAFFPLPGAPWVVLGNLKLKLLDFGRLKVAAHVSLGYMDGLLREDDGDGVVEAGEDDDVRVGAAFPGGVVTFCLDRACRSFLNGYLSAGLFVADVPVEGPVPFNASFAWIQRLGGRAKLALEILAITGDEIYGGFGWYGLRFTWPSFAVDAGLARVFCDECEDDDEQPAVGLPWLAFTYRAL